MLGGLLNEPKAGGVITQVHEFISTLFYMLKESNHVLPLTSWYPTYVFVAYVKGFISFPSIKKTKRNRKQCCKWPIKIESLFNESAVNGISYPTRL